MQDILTCKTNGTKSSIWCGSSFAAIYPNTSIPGILFKTQDYSSTNWCLKPFRSLANTISQMVNKYRIALINLSGFCQHKAIHNWPKLSTLFTHTWDLSTSLLCLLLFHWCIFQQLAHHYRDLTNWLFIQRYLQQEWVNQVSSHSMATF